MDCSPNALIASAICLDKLIPRGRRKAVIVALLCDWANASVTPPVDCDAPIATAATNLAADSFSANWNGVAGALGYRLDVSTDPAFGSFVGIFNNLDVGLALTSLVTGLTQGTIYYYRVRAVCASGTSANSNVIDAVPYPCGAPSDAIRISGAGDAGANQDYVHSVAFPLQWYGVTDPDWHITKLTSTTFRVNYINMQHYQCSVSLGQVFPCTWTVGTFGTAPAPTGQYLPMQFTPSSAVISWTDYNGNHSGNMAAFNATADVATVSSINASSLGLTAFNLSALPALASFDISNNPIVTLNVSNHVLTTLNVNVTGCTAMTTLTCSNNIFLGDILGLATCTALQHLDCSGNPNFGTTTTPQYTFDVSTLTQLLDLNFEINAIAYLVGVQNCTLLTYLTCGFGFVGGDTPLDVHGLTNLVHLECEQNVVGFELAGVNLTGCTALQFLNVATNALTTVDISNKPAFGTAGTDFDIELQNNKLTVAAVDAALLSLSLLGPVGYPRHASLQGQTPPAPPSNPAGLAYLATCTANGWVIMTD